ncbi:hypothetical protein [Lysobacter sp. A3-1-A15]|uniref:hypothetical protein n=1 Tax=Novilysobacter viscosus TaxID=3098602 RepID=UPI002ED8D5B9
MHPRLLAVLATGCALALAGCVQPTREPAPAPVPVVVDTPVQLTVHAGMNDTWNAVGQLLVAMPGVTWEGRSQMMGLNAIRYRGEELMVIARAVPVTTSVQTVTTEVTVVTTAGSRVHGAAATDLLARLERALPAEIERVQAGLAAQESDRQKVGRK